MTGTGRQFKKDCDFVHSVAEKVIDKRKETLVRAITVYGILVLPADNGYSCLLL
ncbi:hypothetical protein DPMN_046598 [Dreissena polymorpha]|uniref:Uncharacterized protein n=1 Tax=Dreissena polymorpha TaxID=45954 RepID=A0A9D4D9W2_DREPO|nr:hypothetical protein DPMN_046598 [Dreissena polymorpha]